MRLFLLGTLALTLIAVSSFGEIYQGKPGTQEPAWLNIKEVEVKQTDSRTLKFTVTFNAEVPRKSTQVENVWLCVDADYSAQTGQLTSYDASFGYDFSLYVSRQAGESKFDFRSISTYGTLLHDKSAVVVKNVRLNGNALSFEVSSKLLFDYKQLKFNLCTTVGTVDVKHGGEVSQYKTISWLSDKKALEFKLK